jgi:hypothetical protein
MPATLTLTATDGQLIAEVTVPTSMADVTLGQWITFVTPGSHEADSVMTGLAPEVLDTLRYADRSQILELLLFLTDAGMLRLLQPSQGLYEIGKCAHGLYAQAEEYFVEHPELTRLAQGAYLYALYRNPTSSKMPEQELAAAHAAVLAASVTEVYADCNHFLASWERHQAGTPILSGPTQPGVLRIAFDKNSVPMGGSATPKPKPIGWLTKLGLGNLWNPDKRAVA